MRNASRRLLVFTLALSSAVLGGTVLADTAENDRKLVTALVEKGQAKIDRIQKLKSNAERLQSLDSALYFLRRGRNITKSTASSSVSMLRADVDASLVRALNAETEIYYARQSLSLAKKRNAEALDVDSDNARALELKEMIRTAENTFEFGPDQHSIAAQRVRDRINSRGFGLRRDIGLGRGR